MLGDFNPYQQWLGIPPEEQPPSLYRLLDLSEGESDANAISQAASQRAAHLRSLRTEENANFLDLLVREIAEAKQILVDPQQRQAYDQQLKVQRKSQPAPPPSPTGPSPSDSEVISHTPSSGSSIGLSDVHGPPAGSAIGAAAAQSGVQAAAGQSGIHAADEEQPKPAASIPAWMYLALGGGVGFLALAAAFLVALVLMRGSDSDQPDSGGETPLAAEEAPPGDDESGTEDGRPELQIEAISDLTVAPGTLVCVPIIVADRPDNTKLNVIVGPATASVSSRESIFAWQTSAADAGSEQPVVLAAEHLERSPTQARFNVRVTGVDEAVDVLGLVDVKTDAVAGAWQEEGGALLSPGAEPYSRVEVRYAPPESYDLDLEVQKIEGATGLQVGLASGAACWSVVLEASSGSGLAMLDGKDYQSNVTSLRGDLFTAGEKSSVRCRVRPQQVQVVVDGRMIINYRGDVGRLSPCDDWAIPHEAFLSFGSHEASYRITNAMLTPVPADSTDPAHQLSDEVPGVVDYEGHRYKVFFDRVTWAEAEQRCEQLGGHLAHVTSGLEQSFVAGILHRPQVWLGAGDQQQEGQWRWTDGSPLEFEQWNTGRPDNLNGDQNYLSMTASGAWDDEAGHTQLAYICEWDPASSEEPVTEPEPVVAETPAGPVPRVAVPAADVLDPYITQFRAYLKRQPLAKPDERTVFLRRMIDLGEDRQRKPVERYVRLHESMRLATEHGHVELAVEAIDALAEQFEMDPLPAKRHAVVSSFQNSATDEQTRVAKEHLVKLVNEALQRDACDVAMQAAQIGYNETLKSEKKQFHQEFVALRKQVQPQFEEWQEFARVEADLEKNQGDPEANLQVGSRYCFRRGDWSAGLPLLAKGGDPRLRALAAAELAGPQTAEEQSDLADAWWEAAASQAGRTKLGVYRHAAEWYQRARPEIKQADQLALIDQRLQELARLEEAPLPESPVEEKAPELDLDKLGLFAGRTGDLRQTLLRVRGGNDQTEQAVAAALKWLTRHQMPDGGWTFDHAAAVGGDGTDGGNMPQARNAATGIVLLALLGAGHSHKSGDYQDEVKNGIRYLGAQIKMQKDRTGSFNEPGGTMYSHGIATQALCEAYALTKDKELLLPCQLSLGHIVRAQHPLGGGWRYKPQEKGDTSVTGWQLTALKLGQAGGINPPPATFALTGKFLDSVQYDGGAKYGYTGPGGSDCTTAIGLLSRIYLGWPRNHAALTRGVEHVATADPADRPMYFNYFATQLLQNYGGEPWDRWNLALRDFLLEKQGTQGSAAGSWFVPGKNSREGGRLCCTALATLMLESYYRYLPVHPETRREIALAAEAIQPEAADEP